MDDHFKTFACHVCDETKNSNLSLKKHYILSHYAAYFKSLKSGAEFPSECQYGLEFGIM